MDMKTNRGKIWHENPLTIVPKVAEYLALASTLHVTSSSTLYCRANQLSFELAMVLPAELYAHIVQAIANPTPDHNTCTAAIAMRAWLGQQETRNPLMADNIARHAPGAGQKNREVLKGGKHNESA
jgi:hypothetical protein